MAIKLWGPASNWVPLEVLALRVDHTESPAIVQLQFRFSYPYWFPWKCLLLGFCSGELQCFCILQSLPFLGQLFSLWPHLYAGSQKSYWFVSLLSFFTCCSGRVATSKLLNARLETLNHHILLYIMHTFLTQSFEGKIRICIIPGCNDYYHGYNNPVYKVCKTWVHNIHSKYTVYF